MMPPEGMEVRRVPEKDTPETAAFEVTLYGQAEAFREAVHGFVRNLATEIFGSPSRALYAAGVRMIQEWTDGLIRGFGGGVPHRLGVREVECFPGFHDPETPIGAGIVEGDPCEGCGAAT